jgi:hypothetical protein
MPLDAPVISAIGFVVSMNSFLGDRSKHIDG